MVWHYWRSTHIIDGVSKTLLTSSSSSSDLGFDSHENQESQALSHISGISFFSLSFCSHSGPALHSGPAELCAFACLILLLYQGQFGSYGDARHSVHKCSCVPEARRAVAIVVLHPACCGVSGGGALYA